MAKDKKKGSGLNRIRKGFRKFSKKIGGSDKFKSPDRLNKRMPIFIKRNIYLKKKFKKRVIKIMAYSVLALHLLALQLYVAVIAIVGCYSQAVRLVATAQVNALTSRSNKDISRK
ncbi:unnamed protein product [Brassica napus]|uniref:(rape) hypothetical protein n=1 Tax=Brassica napus TaxID=3708 RepID=A0A816JM91_BRANA|nr:unnamed protein product [Brassica napus]